ncbi:MAG: hypothetical protein D3923_00380 [Candidatus Electrothrix sp. AR3]|nr:hypothetical protein [Candidatus Electrothrix sp. AR3]
MKITGINKKYTINNNDVAFNIDETPSRELIKTLNAIHRSMVILYHKELHYLNMITMPNKPIDGALVKRINLDIAAVESLC